MNLQLLNPRQQARSKTNCTGACDIFPFVMLEYILVCKNIQEKRGTTDLVRRATAVAREEDRGARWSSGAACELLRKGDHVKKTANNIPCVWVPNALLGCG